MTSKFLGYRTKIAFLNEVQVRSLTFIFIKPLILDEIPGLLAVGIAYLGVYKFR